MREASVEGGSGRGLGLRVLRGSEKGEKSGAPDSSEGEEAEKDGEGEASFQRSLGCTY